MRRLWLSSAMLALGAAFTAMSQVAGAAPERKGGIFKAVGFLSVPIDPQVGYTTTAWWLEYATAAKLYNYPDKRGPAGGRLVPEVASAFKVSPDGRRYTFFIRDGFRFSDGTPVTAASFKYAINRVANRDLASPGASFITDENGTNIVGAKEVHEGLATDVRGVQANGNRLIIDLTRPDGMFLSKITMPFFQATSTKLPPDREVVRIDSLDDLPTAGPYAFSENAVARRVSLRKNPFWTPGPGRKRPRNLDGIDVSEYPEVIAYQMVWDDEADLMGVAGVEEESLARRYGVNKTRFWAMPTNCIGFLPMNMASDLFRRNPRLRRAINYMIGRRAYIAQAGPYAGRPWTHILPPTLPGSRDENPYPLHGDFRRARQLAAGNLRDGKITVYYRSSGTINPAQAEIVRQDLVNLGFRREDITMKGFTGIRIYDAMAMPGNDADIGVSMGWCADFPDPVTQIEGALSYSHMRSPLWRKRLDAASRLVGQERLDAYGKLDIALMRKVAPVAVERTYNNRYFLSSRVDPKSLVFQAVYQDWSIPALALKRE
jgi:ABC-type transport system substrate-binding protein